MAEKADNKRNLSDMSKSFSDAVKTPNISREESVPDAHMIATSTPVSQRDFSESPTLPTAINPLITHQVTTGEDEPLRLNCVFKTRYLNL